MRKQCLSEFFKQAFHFLGAGNVYSKLGLKVHHQSSPASSIGNFRPGAPTCLGRASAGSGVGHPMAMIDINHVRAEATSLLWIYNYVREHYGVKRTGRQMMQKFGVLQRRPGERLNAFWTRFQGFYAENRIRKNDDIKISDSTGKLITAPKDEQGER